MESEAQLSAQERCSFCKQPRVEVSRLVVSKATNTAICSGCIIVILEEMLKQSRDNLSEIQRLQELRQENDKLIGLINTITGAISDFATKGKIQ